ncbi:restriction endonuclease subunit S [Streptomyces djakartensis]|uniref:Type I restriction-modification system restriction endonuclease DNA specificity subunit HsdS n=1 Tax=Streptomyces djakartensis TaxID=68193 RepID=A0ABQ3ACH8_9ACTN|nr:restriction endonuclease subunit S [Streptomyces djakartensis]GGY42077.1 type I restriction-modification system restriction endonuclease DNA specificity subunit HsdS [Streptomyces djakartensis]
MTWKETRLKHLCVDSGQYGLNVAAESYSATGTRLIRTSDIAADGTLRDPESGVHVDMAIEARHQLLPGDILLSRSGTLGRSFLVPEQAQGHTFAGFLIRFRPKPEVEARFLNYTTQSARFQGTVHSEAVASTIQNFNADRYANISMRVPPPEQQRRIADFLDAETARIDAVSQRFRRLTDLAQERVRAVVDDAFAEYQVDSRVPVSAVCRAIVDCVNKTAPVSAETTPYKMIRTSNIRNGEVDLTDAFCVEKDVFIEWNRRGAPRPGDVLFTREAPLGQVGMLRGDENVFLGQRIMLYRANESRIRKELLLFNFLSSHMNRQLRLLGAGSLHEHMRVGDGLKLQVFCPPLEQQDALVTQIQGGRDDGLQLVNLAKRQLALLSERRQALITAAVTGQFDVTTASGRNVTEGVTV